MKKVSTSYGDYLVSFITPSHSVQNIRNRTYPLMFTGRVYNNTIFHNSVFYSIYIFSIKYNILFYQAFLYILLMLELGKEKLSGELI